MIDLDEKPKGANSDDGWYDDVPKNPPDDGLEDLFNADNSGYDEDDPSSKAKSSSPEDIADKEQSADTKDGQDGAGLPNENLYDDKDDSDSSDNEKKTWRRFATKKNGIRAGVGGIAMVAAINIFSISQGPLKLIHMSQLMQRFHFSNDEDFMRTRTGKLIRYMRTKNSPERRNLGYFSNKLADRYEAKLRTAGMDPKYNSSGRLDAIEVDKNSTAGKRFLSQVESRQIITTDLGEGRVRLELQNRTARTRRFVYTAMVDSFGELGKTSSAMAKRLLKTRGGVDLHPLKNLQKAGDEDFSQWNKKFRERMKQRFKRGAVDVNTKQDEENRPQAKSEGADIDPADIELAVDAGEIGDGVEADLEAGKSKAEIKVGLKGKLAVGAIGAATFASMMCGLDELGDNIPKIKHANVVLPLIRIGMDAVAVGAQVQSGQGFNMDELRAMSDDLYDLETKSSAFSDASIQTELGQEPTGPDSMANQKPSTEKPVFFEAISQTLSSIAGAGVVCSALNSTIGSIIGTALDIGVAYFTGTASAALFSAGSTIASYAASEAFMDDLVNWLAGEPVDLLTKGAMKGAQINYGSALAARDSASSHGGADLSPVQSAALDQDRFAREKIELQQKSWFARYFDPAESQSLASRMMFEHSRPSSVSSGFASLFSNPSSGIASAVSGLMPKTSAQTQYDYGFKERGFSLEEMEDEAYDDPFANAAKFEDGEAGRELLERMNNEYGKPCFGVSIDPSTGRISSASDVVRLDGDAASSKCNNRENDELTSYRFYLADMTTAKALMCYEDVDDGSCSELGVDVGASSTGSAGIDIPIIGGDTTNIACAAGTDIGEADGYDEGTLYKIRLCNVNGSSVNSQISSQINELYIAATRDGVILSGSSFRSMEDQKAVFKSWCPNKSFDESCDGAARPGYSNHQMGLAIDFQCDGDLIPQKYTDAVSNHCFQWLLANAGRFGLKEWGRGADTSRVKDGYEGWHWSVDGT